MKRNSSPRTLISLFLQTLSSCGIPFHLSSSVGMTKQVYFFSNKKKKKKVSIQCCSDFHLKWMLNVLGWNCEVNITWWCKDFYVLHQCIDHCCRINDDGLGFLICSALSEQWILLDNEYGPFIFLLVHSLIWLFIVLFSIFQKNVLSSSSAAAAAASFIWL